MEFNSKPKIEDYQLEIRIRMKRRRKFLGLTQKDIAELLGVHRLAYVKLELGHLPIRRVMITKLAVALEVNEKYLLGDVSDTKLANDEINALN